MEVISEDWVDKVVCFKKDEQNYQPMKELRRNRSSTDFLYWYQKNKYE